MECQHCRHCFSCLPESFLPFADAFLGSLLILFTLWRTFDGKRSAWGIATASIVILLPAHLGTANTSPVLIPVGLAIAAFGASVKLRAETATWNAQLVSAAVVGLLVGSATSLRPQFGFPLAVLGVAAVLWPPLGLAVYRLGGLILGATAAVGGLAVASWRAVGTPMFPFFGGNLDPSWPANGVGTENPTLVAVLGRLAGTPETWVSLVALLLGVGVARSVKSRTTDDRFLARWNVRFLAVAVITSIAWLAIVLTIWWNRGEASEYLRFWAPVTLAAVILPMVLIDAGRAERVWLIRVAGLAGLSLVALVLRGSPVDAGKAALSAARQTMSGEVTSTLSADRYESQLAHYALVAARVPVGSKVLAAVDVPSLLLRRGFDIHTLDLAGSTSPPPHLPYFRGTDVKLAWLRQHRYDYIIAVRPRASVCLYNRAGQERNLVRGGVYADWAPYYFDWFQFLHETTIDRRILVAEAGPLLVLRVRPVDG